MNFNCLQETYWQKQIERVKHVREQIASRLNISPGRTIPDTTDLAMGTGRRLSAAIMFLDICGFSNRPCETEYEQTMLMAALNLFFSEMIKIAEDYGGTVEKNTGDGLMTYFEDGKSIPPENGPHRAVACALTMMAASEFLLNPILNRSGIEPIKFRVCIDYGNVTIAKLGAARRFNAIVAIGTTANIASKMLSIATANQILVGENAKNRLPIEWQVSWIKLKKYETGWVFRANNLPYPFYIFDAHWARLF